MRSFIFLLLLIGIPLPSYAQLSPRQKADDFLAIVASYDRLYAPLPLVSQETGFNPLKARPWVERAKVTASDAEFYQLCRRYLARFGNTQDTLNLTPGPLFGATLGFTINYYNNTLLIDSIDRDALPETQYPFQIGDQLLSVDHRSIDQWLDALIPLVAAVNPDFRRSLAANLIVNRNNPMLPFTPQPGDMATITVRRQNGRVEDYSVKWVVQGTAVAEFGPLRAQAPQPAPASPLANILANRHMPFGALSACGAEAFAAVFQDNQRGPIAGKRTQGAGGALELLPGGFFSEATLTITRTLFVREQPGSGKLSYIQNAGVTPDIFLDFMTKENLTGGGRAFVRGFTRSMVSYLRAPSHP